MDSKKKLPEGWIVRKSKSRGGREFYHNAKLNLSVWNLDDLKNESLKHQQQSSSSGSRKSSSTNGVIKTPEKRSHGVAAQSRIINKKNMASERMKNLQQKLAHDRLKFEQLSSNDLVKEISKKNERPPSIDKKNTASNRMKNLKSELKTEIENEPTTSTTTVIAKKRNDVNFNNVIEDDVEMMDICESKNSPVHEVFEPMEWEDISEEKILGEIEKLRHETTASEDRFIDIKTDLSDKNCHEFYIVVDTNVFLRHISFIDSIKGKQFTGIGRATIYIPYIVHVELDKLKLHKDEAVARTARLANSYIDKKLTEQDRFLTGHGATGIRKMITINSPDDEILNSCLVLKEEKTKKVLLLTNDKNLRNKARLSGVQSFSSAALADEDFNAKNSINLSE